MILHFFTFCGFCLVPITLSQTVVKSPIPMAEMFNRVALLERQLYSTMSTLQHTMDELQSTRQELQTVRSDFQQELEGVRDELNVTRLEIADTTQELEITYSELQITSERLRMFVANVSRLDSRARSVAFHVHLSSTRKPPFLQPIRFDSLTYNIGGGYSTQTGKFTAPVAGVYIFTAQAEMYRDGTSQAATLYLVQSGSYIGGAFDITSRPRYDRSIMTSAIAKLNRHEQVWVALSYSVQTYATYKQETQFNGALISAL